MRAKRAAPGAIKDSFYRQILAGLEGHLDDQTFERAVCDLLRGAFPSLVPIPGGSDRGMDGAIADGEGAAFPLVCTTSQDVIGNLTASLDSYLTGGGSRRKVVLATSQALTTQRRFNLEQRAQAKGFTLIQVVEQHGLADRLYRSSYWLKELLGLTGAPSALSVVPLTRRPLVELPLIGRDKELDWLRSTSGDRLIVGQPGSGKTFLLTQLVRERGWLFLVSDDETAIAAALRDQQPAAVIVDDAHTDPSQLDRLRRLRRELGAEFDIVATTWPGEQEAVRSALGTPAESQVLKLDLMPRRKIKELLEHLGIREQETGPELVRELIEQSANKPGLAVTLALVWLRGEWRSLVAGKAIDRALLPLFEERVGKEVRGFLTAFAIGGSRGMSLEAVAEFHGLSLLEAWQKAASLAAGGVLAEVDRRTLAVVPRMLRVALLRTVFFPEEGPRRSFERLLEQAHPGAAAEVLAEAAIRGAKVPSDMLHQVLRRADPRDDFHQFAPRAWSLAALLNPVEAEWVLDHYPGDLTDVARSALERSPQQTIGRLLKAAETIERKLYSRRSHPLTTLASWIQDTEIKGPEEPLRRRRVLARAARSYLEARSAQEVGTEALFSALSPKVEGSRDDALGSTVHLYFGLAPESVLAAISDLWEEVRGAVPPLDSKTWPLLHGFLWNWIYPHHAAGFRRVEPEVEAMMKGFALRVLQDLCPQAEGRPGIGTGLRGLAAHLGAQLPLAIDPVFSLLYPSTTDEGEHEIEDGKGLLISLAQAWEQELSTTVAERLEFYEAEARVIDHQRWPRRPVSLVRRIAAATSYPESWLDAFLARELKGDLAQPFLAEIVRRREEGWVEQALRCLDATSTAPWAFELILRQQDPPPRLLERALHRAPDFVGSVETLSLRRELPLPILSALLTHPDWRTAFAAAIGEWNAEPQGQVRGEIQHEWRTAILRSPAVIPQGSVIQVSGGYWLAQILAGDAGLSLEWWMTQNREHRLPGYFLEDELLRSTIRALTSEQRRQLLVELVPQSGLAPFLPLLVDREENLFAQLISLHALEDYHLAALSGKPDARWADLAWLALRNGYPASDVASAAFRNMIHSTSYPGLEYWTEWDEAFAALESDPRPEVREVAAEGRKLARSDIEGAHKKQREFDLHGW